MKNSILAMAIAMTLSATVSAQQQAALQLPPPTPAQAPVLDARPQPAAATAPPAVTAPPATQAPKPKARRAAAQKKPVQPTDPYADLPINEPAREALRRSDAWSGNNSATVSTGADGRVVFVFGESMPTVVCSPLRMCDIELQPGEMVVEEPHIGVGLTMTWV